MEEIKTQLEDIDLAEEILIPWKVFQITISVKVKRLQCLITLLRTKI